MARNYFNIPDRHSRLLAKLIFCALAVIALCVVTAHAQSKRSGISGTITWYVGTPIAMKEPPRPFVGTMLVKTAPGGKVVATIRSDSSGHFFAPLPPGHYYVTETGQRRYPIIEWIPEPIKNKAPWQVIKEGILVRPYAITRVTLVADSGIRG